MAGMFDDLIPAKGGEGMFADLIPKAKPKGVYGDAPKRGQSRSVRDEVQGFMSHLNRSLLIGDEVTAAGATVGNVLTGKTRLQDAPKDFSRNMLVQRGVEQDYQTRRPLAASTAQGVGNSALLVAPGVKAAQGGTLAGNVARGALTASTAGYVYGAADAGTVKERLDAGARNAVNPLTLAVGAAGGALAPRSRPAPSVPTQRQADNANMRDLGVQLSIPQKAGGVLKQIEDLAQRAPILGPAISGSRARQGEQLVRGVALTALRPIGKTLPADVKPGFDMVNYVDDAIGEVYEQATALVPRVTPDQGLADDLARIAQRRADLPTNVASQYDSIIASRLQRLREGEVDGAMVKQIHGELGKLQGEAARKGEVTLAEMLGDARRAVIGVVERASPEARRLIRDADEAWSAYSVMNDAAAAASAKGGVFGPGQLNTQSRAGAKRIGSNMAGKGSGPLQNIATSASRTLPDQFGNPGTANALGLGAGGVGLMTEPGTTLAVAGGLTAAATPYWLSARKILEELPAAPSQAQVNQVESQLAQLAKSDPAVARLLEQVRARLGRAAAVATSQPTQEPRNVLATGTR